MLRQQVIDQIKTALKAKDQLRLDALRYLLSQIKNEEIDLKREVNDQEVIKLIQSEVKKRTQAIDQFKSGGREDIVKDETIKLKVLEEFLPDQLSREEIEAIVDQIKDPQDNFGSLMKKTMNQVKGQADGKLVAEIINQKL